MIDYSSEPMTAIDINNPELIETLDQWLWFMNLRDGDTIPHIPFKGDNSKADYYTSHEYLRKIQDKGQDHDGFPEEASGYTLDYRQSNGNNHTNIYLMKNEPPEFVHKFKQNYDKCCEDLQTLLGVRYNALAHIYPPGGFIGWHNNANAAAFNVLFTWSETGDGYWEHVDPRTDEIIHIPDKKGWNCKVGYYGHYGEWPSKLVYHTARTNCWRMTVAFTLTTKDSSIQMWNMIAEDIQGL
jgi:hypothetical protein